MVVLKKIKGSTIMETLIATVLIIVIFMLSSMILNNLFSSTIRNNTRLITSHLNELEYLYHNDKLSIPYQDDYQDWTIAILKKKQDNLDVILFSAYNLTTKKTVELMTYK
ncbi:hypothetical protein A9Q86_01545 [Flavobacteriales bacterium 33_180_T64]|nr:hypothetical protein A9Q86_01545 [Flavobacteriales bacterium 33_180_T64]